MAVTWEQRWHPLREEWVILAAHRQDRPWTGETIKKSIEKIPEYDPDCYLCPGNKRVNGIQNDNYEQTFVFDNDHACVSWDAPEVEEVDQKFYKRKPAHSNIADLSHNEFSNLAQVLKHVLIKFDNLWKIPFPYVMPLHQSPTDGKDYGGFHFHFEFHPPLRKPNLLKYLAGPEIAGGNFLSDTSPEEKAEELRQQSEVHYKVQEE
jgi:galactose-1-phosphate uridylyltransferase